MKKNLPEYPEQIVIVTLNDDTEVACDLLDEGRFRVAVAGGGYDVGDWIAEEDYKANT